MDIGRSIFIPIGKHTQTQQDQNLEQQLNPTFTLASWFLGLNCSENKANLLFRCTHISKIAKANDSTNLEPLEMQNVVFMSNTMHK